MGHNGERWLTMERQIRMEIDKSGWKKMGQDGEKQVSMKNDESGWR